MPVGFLLPIQSRADVVTWLRSRSLLVGTVIIAIAVFGCAWGVVYVLRALAEASISTDALATCVIRHADNADAFNRCVHPPAPRVFRSPPLTALVIAVLTAPLAWRWLRPWHAPADEDRGMFGDD